MLFKLLAATAVSLASVLAAPTLYLVGDSTMAKHNNDGTQGWGVYAPNYFTGATVVNKAISGRSARSFTREGRWTEVQNLLKSGDFVVIEFGHNDGGSPSSSDRAAVGGEGDETQTVTLSNGTKEVVHTFPWYIKQMIDGAKSKGATPIISSQTPNNPYENSATIINSPSRFVNYAKNAATAKGVPYVDHFASSIQLYSTLGKSKTESYFPNDHTHTNEAGADQVALSFMSGLKCSSSSKVLDAYMNDAGRAAVARC